MRVGVGAGELHLFEARSFLHVCFLGVVTQALGPSFAAFPRGAAGIPPVLIEEAGATEGSVSHYARALALMRIICKTCGMQVREHFSDNSYRSTGAHPQSLLHQSYYDSSWSQNTVRESARFYILEKENFGDFADNYELLSSHMMTTRAYKASTIVQAVWTQKIP